MGLFSKAKSDSTIERKDVIGGFKPLDSNVYPYKITQAYATESEGGAQGVVIEFDLTIEGADKPRKLNQTIFFTDKEGKTYWEKDNRKGNLPGFEIIDDLVANATLGEKGILSEDLDFEEKTIQVKKDGVQTPKIVNVISELIGSEGELAILHETVDETKKSDAHGGAYMPTGAKKSQNTISKVFGESGHTINELCTEIEQPVFKGEWISAWQGKVKDSTKGTGKGAAKPSVNAGNTASAPKTSLFKKK